MILSNYITIGTEKWNRIRAHVTNSSTVELLRRLIQYASDVTTMNEIHLNSPSRALSILSTRSFLTTLLGHLVNFLEDNEVHNVQSFLSERETMLPRWRQLVTAFKEVNTNMKENKYAPMHGDPHFKTSDNPVNTFSDSSVSLTLIF